MASPRYLSLDVEKLSQKFLVDPTSPTGLRWKVDHWNMKAGDIAGTVKDTGHCIVNFYGKRFHVHRIVWALHHHQDPGFCTIDHIDRNPSNNDPDNLRLATHEGQLRNTKDRPSEYGRGVHKNDNRYYARITIGSKTVSLGGFDTAEKARQVSKEAREAYLLANNSTLYPIS